MAEKIGANVNIFKVINSQKEAKDREKNG